MSSTLKIKKKKMKKIRNNKDNKKKKIKKKHKPTNNNDQEKSIYEGFPNQNEELFGTILPPNKNNH